MLCRAPDVPSTSTTRRPMAPQGRDLYVSNSSLVCSHHFLAEHQATGGPPDWLTNVTKAKHITLNMTGCCHRASGTVLKSHLPPGHPPPSASLHSQATYTYYSPTQPSTTPPPLGCHALQARHLCHTWTSHSLLETCLAAPRTWVLVVKL